MAAGSPTAALAPARPASPLKALSFWGTGARPKPAACIPCQDVKTMGLEHGSGHDCPQLQSPPMVNVRLPRPNLAAGKVGSAGGWPLCRGTWRRRFPPPLRGGLWIVVQQYGDHRDEIGRTQRALFLGYPSAPPPPKGEGA